jgi:cold shock CspA family protein
MFKGTIKFFNAERGFGFVVRDDGPQAAENGEKWLN